jgi:hypothetical protein
VIRHPHFSAIHRPHVTCQRQALRSVMLRPAGVAVGGMGILGKRIAKR